LLHYPVSRAEWLDARLASITPNDAALALASRAAQRCRIAILTNNCRLLTDHIGYLNPPVARLFGPHVYSSAAFGAAKPATQTYQRCVEHLGAAAADTLFIDDFPAPGGRNTWRTTCVRDRDRCPTTRCARGSSRRWAADGVRNSHDPGIKPATRQSCLTNRVRFGESLT
jgi:FMN phosphatase YigB (HAD superfamily)